MGVGMKSSQFQPSDCARVRFCSRAFAAMVGVP